MPSLQNFLKRSGPGAEPQRRFENWPPPTLFKPVPAGKSGLPVLSDLSAGTKPAPDKYGAEIVIGLGRTGEIVLRQWLEKLDEDPSGEQTGLRAILITHQLPTEPLPNRIVKTRLLQLEHPNTRIGLRPASKGLRGEMNILFRQVVNYQSFIDWLSDCLLALRKGIRVFVVGSMAEPIIGLVGDILQILHVLPESRSQTYPYSNINTLLSMVSAESETLPREEIFAVQREIGRFMFNGRHFAGTSFGFNRRASSALLDHLFLVEGYAENMRDGFEAASFELGIGQILSEALFTLSHPSAASLWENLVKDLGQAGQIRSELHKITAHSLGIATLYVPAGAVQDYIAARLAYAALYGERTDRAEGLLAPNNPQTDDRVIKARRWLLDGPCKHPLFTWLLDATGPADFMTVPSLDPDFEAIFQTQLAHGLVNFMNNSAGSDLALTLAGLEYLTEHLVRVDGWFKSVRTQNPNAPERLSFQSLLNGWLSTLHYLIATVQAWQKTLQPAATVFGSMFVNRNHDARPSTTVIQATWRKHNAIHPISAATPLAPSGIQISSVLEYLRRARQASETTIAASTRGCVIRSVTGDGIDELKEVDVYYQDSVRPELSRYITENSTAFARVRERLEWWVNLVPGQQPELLLLCWIPGAKVEPGGTPPPECCFKPVDAEALGTAMLKVGRAQAQGRVTDLTGAWFGKRIKKMADFLHRAAKAYIAFDMNIATVSPHAAARRSYLIAHDAVGSRNYLDQVFPDTLHLEVNELGGGEANRFTALTFRLNIPVEAIYTLQQAYPEYQNKSAGSLHLYTQEATATIYEKRIWNIEGERILLPPDLTVLLADPQLVTLFCQAVIFKVIAVQRDKHSQISQWIVPSQGKEFIQLVLAPADADGLWHALRSFALELPNDPEIYLNPTNHFYRQRRNEYIAELTKTVKERFTQPDARASREEFKETILENWRQRGEHDLLAKAFAHLLNTELDEPVWKGW